MNGRYERYMQFVNSGSPIVPITYIAEVLCISYTDAVCDLQEMAALGYLGRGAYINYKDRTLVLKPFSATAQSNADSAEYREIRERIRRRKEQRDREYTVQKAGKSTADDSKSKKRGGILSIAAIGVILANISALGQILDEFMYWGISWDRLSQAFFSLAFIGGAGYFLYRRTVLESRKKRIEKYKEIIGKRQAISIDKLSEYTLVKPKTVKKDLEYAIKKDLLGTKAHFSADRQRLLMSFDEEQTKKETPKYAASSSTAETKNSTVSRSDEKVEDRYDAIIREIHELNDEIADEVVSEKIEQIESITAKIFKLVREHPDKEPEIKTLMSYYLPTTLKLLRSYALFEKQGIKGENIDATLSDIDRILDTLVKGFSQQLDRMFRAEAMDISTDIEVLESMMEKDGLSGGSAFQVSPDKEQK